jgi:predicted RNA-binding protein associated with RNAse of E/G family
VRSDFAGGISFTFIKEGYKISRFLDRNGQFLYWYCDIVDVEYDQALDSYLINDLLLDMKLMPDGKLVILDSDELAEALETSLITVEQAGKALRRLDKLLQMVYSGIFPPEICNSKEYSV